MITTMLMMLGGFMMMLDPLFRATARSEVSLAPVLREAYPPEPRVPADMRWMLGRIH